MKKVLLTSALAVFATTVLPVSAAIYTDNFDGYADGTNLLDTATWYARVDKNYLNVDNGHVYLGAKGGAEATNAAWWRISPEATDTYEKVSLEFNTGDTTASVSAGGYVGALKLALNQQNWAASGFYQDENSYIFAVRGVNDIYIARTDGNYFDTTATPTNHSLEAYTDYRAVFERNGAVLTGTIESLDGTILSQVTVTDPNATLLTGGNAGFISYFGPDYTFDNFTYMTQPIPEPMSVSLLAIAGVGLLMRRR